MPESGYVPPEINVEREGAVLIVGRDPGGHEVLEGRPFVGRAGEKLDAVLAETGLPRHEINIANVVGYQPKENKFSNHDDRRVSEGLEALRGLVKRLKPSLIVTLGNEAAYALLEGFTGITSTVGWPTNGRGIFGAKNIAERRGYFWPTRHGMVLTTLHPAGVLRQEVPGDYLLRFDFRKARRYLRGTLTNDTFPNVKRLNNLGAVNALLASSLIAWDIETKWANTAMLCSGYCGDSGQPYVSLYPGEFNAFGRLLLESRVPLCGHNGGGFDVPALQQFEGITVNNYRHDTQQMWWALEPELAGQDEADETTLGGQRRSRMTRKGLAFLASIYFGTLPWWKDYPEEGREDEEAIEQMITLNGRDVWVTRLLAGWLYQELSREDVLEQYNDAMALYPVLQTMLLRGITIDEEKRQERYAALKSRYQQAKDISQQAGLPYITEHDLRAFRTLHRCECCGGGKVQAKKCWRCAGFAKKPLLIDLKARLAETTLQCAQEFAEIEKPKKADYERLLLHPCIVCAGKGKTVTYDFNPYSHDQIKKLLYDCLGVPKSTWKGKTVSDNAALKKILKWAKE